MSDARELYQEIILDHNKRPRNFQRLEDANRTAEGHNPLCGDRISLYLRIEGDKIGGIGFQGSGCAISKASASLMTTLVKGKTEKEAEALVDRFRQMVSGIAISPEELERLGKLAVFSGVSEFPARVKCASLAWHTLKAALESRQDAVTTE